MVNNSIVEENKIFEIAIAALLHDIGKFYQRAVGNLKQMPPLVFNRASIILPPNGRGGNSHWHALWSDAFFEEYVDKNPFPKNLNKNNIRDCAVFHHRPDENNLLTHIITEADRIASGMERKEKDAEQDSDQSGLGKQEYRKTNLVNIFSKIDINIKNEDNIRPVKYQKLSKFNPANFAPLQSNSTDSEMPLIYNKLWQEFCVEYKTMAEKSFQSTEIYLMGLSSLLEKYTWAIPSSTIDEPDVSLYDHAMATSAVAACLYDYHKYNNSLNDKALIQNRKINSLRFIIGDLSGIQNCLFTLASEGARGLPKLLRGRSLRMQIIVQAAAQRILAQFNLPSTCIIQNAGGRFVIIAPFTNQDSQCQLLDELRQEFDEYIRDQYQGDLIFNLSLSEAFCANDLIYDKKNENESKDKIARTLGLIPQTAEFAKLNPLRGARDAIWKKNKWDKELGICKSCGKRPAITQDNLNNQSQCKACHSETKLGRDFPKSKALIIDNIAKPLDEIFGLNVALPSKLDDEKLIKGWQFNYDENTNYPFGKKFLQAYVPTYNENNLNDENLIKLRTEDDDAAKIGDILTFEEIASFAKGVKHLAILKADVDRLGQIFAKGLGDNKSLARIASLSRMLDAFFNGKLPEILKNQFPNIYTVYAGGDDLLLLGPWNEVLKFATVLNQEFTKHVGNNHNITISAGISLFSPNTPISRAAHDAEERLKKAKEDGRNRIHVFNAIEDDALTWSQYAKIMSKGNELDKHIRDNNISSSLLHKLLFFEKQRQLSKNNVNFADWKAKLGYLLWRLFPDKKDKDKNQSIRNFILDIMGITHDFKFENEQFSTRAAIAYAIYLNRGN